MADDLMQMSLRGLETYGGQGSDGTGTTGAYKWDKTMSEGPVRYNKDEYTMTLRPELVLEGRNKDCACHYKHWRQELARRTWYSRGAAPGGCTPTPAQRPALPEPRPQAAPEH